MLDLRETLTAVSCLYFVLDILDLHYCILVLLVGHHCAINCILQTAR